MPGLDFLLANSVVAYRAEKNSEEWFISANAKIQRTHERFDVLIGSETYDGFTLECGVAIEERTPENVDCAQQLARHAVQSSDGKLEAKAIDECVGTIALIYSSGDGIEPYMEITVLQSADALLRTQQQLHRSDCCLSIQTDPFEAGLMHGIDPDGRDLKWLVDRVEVAIIKSFSLRFMTMLKGAETRSET